MDHSSVPRASHLSPAGRVLTLLSMIMSHPPLSATPLAQYLRSLPKAPDWNENFVK
jgi:hypothetical protein